MPSGSGKVEKICFFCVDDGQKELARSLGVDIIGDDSTLAEIRAGTINFDKCYATPDGVAL
jgi:large subunit ribosomal protein L1